MSQPAIIVDGISKRYRLGNQASPHQTFREMATGMLTAPFRKLRAAGHGGNEGEDFWALKDVSFEVQPGEVVGIIGRNGAGKSTLLKILSRITDPTSGQIRMRGRVASLLEVGTGFHPELTGRENIYLNGAILGMKRAEITKKFDEIVAFAETEKFLDTPVKFYSSGMYVRLAFAVAAHLEPEILIVDEVLAVGDAEFQKKCLGKMRDVATGEGRTVLFVSHNMAAIRSLCARTALLRMGTVIQDGQTEGVIQCYLDTLGQGTNKSSLPNCERAGTGQVRLKDIVLLHNNDVETDALNIGEPIVFRFRLNRPWSGVDVLFCIYDRFGNLVTPFDSRVQSPQDVRGEKWISEIRCQINEIPLVPGRYRVNVALYEKSVLHDHIEGAMLFEVQEGLLQNRYIANGTPGTTAVTHRWDFTTSEDLAPLVVSESKY